jgi:hypothetical protein
MSDHSSSEHGADNAAAVLENTAGADENPCASTLPVPTFAGADIIGGLSTPTMNDSEKEQREQSRRLMVIIECQRIQLQAQHDALLLLLQKGSRRMLPSARARMPSRKTVLSYLMCFAGMHLTI